MSWNRILERDAELCERMAFQGDLTAGLLMKARRAEAERQSRREREAAEWRAYEEQRHAAPAAPPPVEGVSHDELWQMTEAIAVAVKTEVVAPILARVSELETRTRKTGSAWDSALTYQEGEVVAYGLGGAKWRCVRSCRGYAPDRRPEHWIPWGHAAGASPPSDELAPLHLSFNGKDRRR